MILRGVDRPFYFLSKTNYRRSCTKITLLMFYLFFDLWDARVGVSLVISPGPPKVN